MVHGSVPNSQNDVESRFAHLLQPIRDLAKNWDIDIASQLEDYLAEVRTLEVVAKLVILVLLKLD